MQSKLSPEELEQAPSHTNYTLKNVNKPGKVRVDFGAGAKFQSTSLNKYLSKSPGLLNRLIRVLIRF